ALSSSINSKTNISCFGGNNGAIDLSVAGGTPPYSYNWSNSATTQDLSNLSAGNYTVTATDANGCTILNSAISITQPAAALDASAGSTTNVSCYGGNNGSINLTVSGGTSPYSYNWSNGATTQNTNSLSAGTY